MLKNSKQAFTCVTTCSSVLQSVYRDHNCVPSSISILGWRRRHVFIGQIQDTNRSLFNHSPACSRQSPRLSHSLWGTDSGWPCGWRSPLQGKAQEHNSIAAYKKGSSNDGRTSGRNTLDRRSRDKAWCASSNKVSESDTNCCPWWCRKREDGPFSFAPHTLFSTRLRTLPYDDGRYIKNSATS